MNIAQVFDDECRRFAERERIDMRDAIEGIASVLGVEARQVYGFRRGTTSLPAKAIPVLCRFFNSDMLLKALEEDCRAIPFSEETDLVELAMELSETAVPLSNDLIRFAQSPRPPYEKLCEISAGAERLVLKLRR